MPGKNESLNSLYEWTADFFGAAVRVAEVEKEGGQQSYVPLQPLLDFLGISYSRELKRIEEDPILKEELCSIRLTNGQEILALPMAFFHGWLLKLPADEIPDERRRSQVAAFRRRAIETLHRALGPVDLEDIFGTGTTNSSDDE